MKIAQLTIDKILVELTYPRRMKYGRSSEKLEHAHLDLVGGQVAAPAIGPTREIGADDGLKSKLPGWSTVNSDFAPASSR